MIYFTAVPELEGQTKEEFMLVEGESAVFECRVRLQSSPGLLRPGTQSHYNITWTKAST